MWSSILDLNEGKKERIYSIIHRPSDKEIDKEENHCNIFIFKQLHIFKQFVIS